MLVDSIYTLLSAVNENTYPGVAEQEVNAPFIVHSYVRNSPSPSKDGASTKDLVICRVGSFDTTQRGAQSQADTIRTTLDEYDNRINGVDLKIRFADEENGYDDESQLFYTLQSYRIWINYET